MRGGVAGKGTIFGLPKFHFYYANPLIRILGCNIHLVITYYSPNDTLILVTIYSVILLMIHLQEAELAQQKETPPSKVPQGAEGGAEPHGRPQQETFGGYDCEFVEPPTSAFQTECPICSLILRVQTN